MFSRFILHRRLYRSSAMCCWFVLQQFVHAAGMFGIKLLPSRFHVARPLSSRLLLRSSQRQDSMQHNVLLSC